MSENLNEVFVEAAPQPICKTSVVINAETQKRTNKKVRTILFILLIVGAVGLVAWIALSVAFEMTYEDGRFPQYEEIGGFFDVLLWVSAVFFACGAVFFFASNKNVKNAEKLNQENIYSFYENSFTIETMRAGESLGVIKTYYADLVKTREQKEFFLLYPTAVTFYPVDKTKLFEEEIAALRRVLPMKRKKNAVK